MKALIYDGNKNISIGEWPKPQLFPNEQDQVIVKVNACGICGTDIGVWDGGFKRVNAPCVLGHEVFGEIIEIGDNIGQDFALNDRVVFEPVISCGTCKSCRTAAYNVCNHLKIIGVDVGYDGGFAEYVKVSARRIHKVPADMSAERAALCEPVSIGVHMVRRAGAKLGDEVLIIGAGPIGLLAAITAKAAGVSKIIITEINPYRIKLAQEFGFAVYDSGKITDDDLLALFNGNHPDICFDAVGSQTTYEQAIKLVKMNGAVLCAGLGLHEPIKMDMVSVSLKELHLIGTRLSTYYDFEVALELLSNPNIPFEKLVSKTVTLENAIKEGFHAIKQGDPIMKVLVTV